MTRLVLPPLRRTARDAEAFAQVEADPYSPPPGKRNDYNPAGLPQEARDWHEGLFRQTDVLREMPRSALRALWDQYDGCNAPDGFEGEAIHLALNMIGDGDYCAI